MGFNRNQIDRVLSNNTESKDGGSMMSMEELLMILTLEVDEPGTDGWMDGWVIRLTDGLSDEWIEQWTLQSSLICAMML